MTAKEVTWWYRQPEILVQLNLATKRNLLVPDSLVTKICAPELTSAIYCIVWTFFSLQQAKTCNPQKYRLTEWAVCMWVTSKLTYWYIHNVCSVASRVKGYQALPFLTFHHHRSGEEPGNETIDFLPDAKGLSMVDKCAILSEAAWLHTWLHIAV